MALSKALNHFLQVWRVHLPLISSRAAKVTEVSADQRDRVRVRGGNTDVFGVRTGVVRGCTRQKFQQAVRRAFVNAVFALPILRQIEIAAARDDLGNLGRINEPIGSWLSIRAKRDDDVSDRG